MESGLITYFARLTRNEWRGKEATEKKGKEEVGNKKEEKGRGRQKERQDSLNHSTIPNDIPTSNSTSSRIRLHLDFLSLYILGRCFARLKYRSRS